MSPTRSRLILESSAALPVAFALVIAAAAPARAEVEKPHPCKKLTAACEAAGYLPGQRAPGKNLHADCMKKLLAGVTVEGVTLAEADVSACKAKKSKKGAKKSGMPASD
jgi:hypothetical protein